MQIRMNDLPARHKSLSGELATHLAASEEQRRRVGSMQDPSLLFGAAVFAQMVAGDLARETGLASDEGDEFEGGEGADDQNVLAMDEAQGLFGTVAGSATGLMPIAGGVAVLAGVPGSGSDATSQLGSGSAANTPAEAVQEENPQQNSVLARNVSTVRNGGRPSPDGAQETSPDREAAGAQASASETQQQFAGAGGANPFVPPSPQAPDVPVQAAPAQTTPAPVGVAAVESTDIPAPSGTTVSSQDNTELPLESAFTSGSLSSAAWPQTSSTLTLLEPVVSV